MIFDGYDFSHLLVVEEINRPLMPRIDNRTVSLSGDGSRTAAVRLEAGEIEVKVRIIECSKSEYEKARREIAGRLWGREARKLVLHDAPDLYNMAYVADSTDVDKLLNTGGVTLRFHCDDPVSYGMEQSRSCEGGTVWCNVGGNFTTAPIIEVTTDASNAVVYVDGNPMTALGTVSGDQPLTFDCVTHEVTKGDAVVKMSIFDDFAEWEAGTHAVECELPFTVRWVERWL